MPTGLDERLDRDDKSAVNPIASNHMRLLYLSLNDVPAFERAVLDGEVQGLWEAVA